MSAKRAAMRFPAASAGGSRSPGVSRPSPSISFLMSPCRYRPARHRRHSRDHSLPPRAGDRHPHYRPQCPRNPRNHRRAYIWPREKSCAAGIPPNWLKTWKLDVFIWAKDSVYKAFSYSIFYLKSYNLYIGWFIRFIGEYALKVIGHHMSSLRLTTQLQQKWYLRRSCGSVSRCCK